MTSRIPPRCATWLLQRLGPSYQKEALAGDLYEEYQLNRTQAWYWRQVVVAVFMGLTVAAREVCRRIGAIRHSARLLRLTMSALLRFSIEAAAILGAITLADEVGGRCAFGPPSSPGSLTTLAGGVGLCLSVGMYLSLCRPGSQRARNPSPTVPIRKGAPIKRLLAVFAVTTLSAGTLTWAHGESHTPGQCTYPGSAPVTAAASLLREPVHGK